MDSQQVELLGRNLLISLFIEEDIEVAIPIRDKGIDLLAFLNVDETGKHRVVPIQIKVASAKSFSIDPKYKKFAGIYMAYVWYTSDTIKSDVYILAYDKADKLIESLKYKRNAQGKWNTSAPSQKLTKFLEKYKYQPGRLRNLLGLD